MDVVIRLSDNAFYGGQYTISLFSFKMNIAIVIYLR